MSVRLKVAILADRRGGEEDAAGRAIMAVLPQDAFDAELLFADERPARPVELELVLALSWRTSWHKTWNCDAVVKRLSDGDLRSMEGSGISLGEAAGHWCRDAVTLAVSCVDDHGSLAGSRPLVRIAPASAPAGSRTRLADELRIAVVADRWPRKVLSKASMSTDIALASPDDAEAIGGADVAIVLGGARAPERGLLAALGAGCFPLAPAAGMAKDLVGTGLDGILVRQDAGEIAAALDWCAGNPDAVRRGGMENMSRLPEVLSPASSNAWERILIEAWHSHRSSSFDMAAGWLAPAAPAPWRRVRAEMSVRLRRLVGRLPKRLAAPVLVIDPTEEAVAALKRAGYARVDAIAISPAAGFASLLADAAIEGGPAAGVYDAALACSKQGREYLRSRSILLRDSWARSSGKAAVPTVRNRTNIR